MILNIIWPVITLGGLAVFFGIVLAYASKRFAVETDPRVGELRNLLPGANCGGCGFAGCDALADAIVKGAAPIAACPVGGSVLAEKIGALMGVKAQPGEKYTARVLCCGDKSNAKEKYTYQGIMDCNAAQALAGGAKSCPFGCLGLGSCTRACPFGAIDIINGAAVVDENKCTACKKCITACPKKIIELVPQKSEVRVMCKNTNRGKAVMESCKVGCISCQKCVKACTAGAIIYENNLPRIDYDKCTGCMACVQACPTKTIYGKLSDVSGT